MSEQESGQVSEQEKEAIKELIDSSNLSLIGDGTMIVKNTTIATTLNYIDKLQKENTELKEDNSHQWEERCRLTFELERLQEENQELKEKLHEKNLRIIKLNKLLGGDIE